MSEDTNTKYDSPGRNVLGIAEHVQRYKLHSEMHVGAAEFLEAPTQVSHLTMLSKSNLVDNERAHIALLCERYGVNPPTDQVNHFNADMGLFRIKWERHTEYCTYTFFRCAPFDVPFVEPAISHVPKDWLAGIPGEVISATHVALEGRSVPLRSIQDLSALFASNTVCGAEVAAGSAIAWTDNQIHADGFGRILIHDVNLRKRQAGRLVQRLLEVETYRMLAMLTVPVMKSYIPKLANFDERLADITQRHRQMQGIDDEQVLLSELTQLASEIERIFARTSQRYNAATMYYDIVKLRISELRERRIQGLQMFREFMEQRLSSAMGTCGLVNNKLETLSLRVQRTTSLLRTRVELSMEHQTQDLLESMDKRAHLQLRLQETVEGLSIVVLSYYLLGLVSYGLKALKGAGMSINTDLATGLAIPLVVGVVFLMVRYIRRSVHV